MSSAAASNQGPAGQIRPYRKADLTRLEEICILTGDSGEDATTLYTFPELLPAVYATPYVLHAPDLAWVALDDTGQAAGYVIASADVLEFDRWRERQWWPALRERFPLGSVPEGSRDEQLISWALHAPISRDAGLVSEFPAELHIDLLPTLQGLGCGRRLMDTALAALEARGVPGVHLGVSSVNERAVGFYRHLGFVELDRGPGVVWFGKTF